MTWSLHDIVVRLLNLFLAIVGFFLILRILLRLLSANPGTPFVGWVYDISLTLMSPFRGIFVNPVVSTVTGQQAVFDIVALVAFIFYSLLVYFLIALVDSVTPTAEEDHSRRPRR